MVSGVMGRGRACLLAAAACGLALTFPARAQQPPPDPAELDPSAPLDPMPDLGVEWPDMDAPDPVPEPEPETEPGPQGGCEPVASATATAATHSDEQHGERGKDAATEQPKEQAPATPPPALAEAPKTEPLRTTVTEAPALDIMREEVHTPRLVRPSQKKRAAPAH